MNSADYIPVKKVRTIQAKLRGEGNLRDALLWTAGPNWALRISDLLSVRVGDVLDADGVKDSFSVTQAKTGKAVTCHNTAKVREAIEEYLSSGQHPEPDNPNAPLFPSNRYDPETGDLKPLGRTRVWYIMQRDAEAVGLKRGSYSPHSWRKTWGRAALDAAVPMPVVQEKLGHRSPGSLLTYLGITEEDVRKASEQIEV